MHMPPPIHGAAMVGKYIHDSQIINNAFDCHYSNLTLAKDLKDIGKGGFRKLKDFCKQIKSIRKKIKLIKPHLCYITPNARGGAFYKDFLVVMLLKVMKQNIVIHYHNKGVATKQNKALDNLLYKLFFKNIKVILLAEPLYQDIQKYVSRSDVYICSNGIPATVTEEKATHSLDKTFEILFLSNMMKEKGVWDVVEACYELKKKGKNFKCHFVGKWSDIAEEAFYTKIEEKGLENFVFAYGAKYGEEKSEFMQRADVFVFPTYYSNECFPLVLLEAMEQELPCISTTEGGISAIIENGKTGFIIKKHSPIEIAEKIEFLVVHPEACISMGKASKEKFLKEFTLEKFEERMKNILEDCTSSTKSDI